MTIAISKLFQSNDSTYREPFPRQVEFIISALEAGPRPIVDRQAQPRMPHRVKATLKLFIDAPDAPARILYTRQASSAGLGFLTNQPIPLSYGGSISLAGPDGKPLSAHCTILRCRQVAQTWYEGAVYFNRPQPIFAPKSDPANNTNP